MRVGTKSLLFGAHQFLLHPFTVWVAWKRLFKSRPTWRETVCILVHDWGYWGCRSMDGEDGTAHPEWAARWVRDHLDRPPWDLFYLCLCHSRHTAKANGMKVSKLYRADKLSFTLIPWWLYIPMTLLSGELWEYRTLTHLAGRTQWGCSHREWHRVVVGDMLKLADDPEAIPYLGGR